MTETKKEPKAAGSSDDVSARLPYRVEILNEEEQEPARLLGRSATAALARAIFVAAQREYPGRPVVLRRGTRIIARSQ